MESKRLNILKESLSKKENAFNAKLQQHFDTVKQANGQPLNDKANGAATIKKWEAQNAALITMQSGIEKTRNAIEREQSKLVGVEKVSEVIPSAILDLVASGILAQWKKHPNIFFVNGVDKARIIWDLKKKVVAHKFAGAITDREQYRIFAQTFNQLQNTIKNNG